jgi:4-hydroxy-tetrahydrodipicolinate synthase
MKVEGIWLPIITPFLDDKIDYDSYKALLEHYISKGISGIIPLGTTGESPSINDYESEKLIDITLQTVNKRIPVIPGVGGNCTKDVVERIAQLAKYDIDGILSVVPYYNRPDQNGIYGHFRSISESMDKNIIIYNIPYRTGVNMENETVIKAAGLKNIIGIKDSCGNIRQSMELIFGKPEGFSVLTGEDLQFFMTLTLGGDGGILASAHIETEKFGNLYRLVKDNNHLEAQKIWRSLVKPVGLLFSQPNPAPLKYLLKKKKLITCDATRLPITNITDDLKIKLDAFI